MTSALPRIAAGALLAALARAAAAAPARQTRYGLPTDASADGFRVDELIHFTILATSIIFVLVAIVLGWSLVKHGRRHEARYSHGSRLSIGLVVGFVALVLVVVDGNLFAHTIVDMRHVFWNFARAESDPDVVRIEVNAQQWSWTGRYPGPDGKFDTPDDVVTVDDLRVPVDAPVVVQLASTDVIHSMYLPNFRVKQDAVPGQITRLTFKAAREGEYEVACAQHCGPNHYKMRAVLTVLSKEAYRDWLRAAEADARRAYDPEDEAARWGWEWRSAR
jgi:cytochrome c oxidase subunit 2